MLSIHTVAAGGGSMLHFDGSRYRVGPDSAGADPGPACYRNGGPLTLTDANVLLGRIQAAYFPHVFGPRGDQPLDEQASRLVSTTSARRSPRATGDQRGPEQVAAGFIEIAVANMANAIKKISVQRGYDVTGYILNVFGGAGGQHACAVADALGMSSVLIHPLAGVLSAYGIGLADIVAMREQAVEAPLTGALITELPQILEPLEAEARAEVQGWAGEEGRAGGEGQAGGSKPKACPPAGSPPNAGCTCATRAPTPRSSCPSGPLEQMTAAFEAEYTRRFSFLMPGKTILAEAVSVEVTGTAHDADTTARSARVDGRRADGGPDVHRRVLGRCGPPSAGRLTPGQAVDGPAIIAERTGHHRGRARLAGPGDRRGDLLLQPRHAPGPTAPGPAPRPTRCCWRSSTTCSCRSPSRWACACRPPRTRSTSRSGSTSPARSSTPTAA